MTSKEPVLLAVLIETHAMRWNVAGIPLSGTAFPLIRSQPGNLSTYVGQPLDEQVSFLRHRLAGVLQRGCDRLWGRQKKPNHIVFVADHRFQQADDELTQRVAEHFVTWMTSPPVVFYLVEKQFDPDPALNVVAGESPAELESLVRQGIGDLAPLLDSDAAWEIAATK